MRAKDIMTATVISVPQGATVAEATELMLAHTLVGCRLPTPPPS